MANINDSAAPYNSRSHIIIDLGSRTSGPALATLTQLERRSHKVKSALIIRPSGTCLQYDVRNNNCNFSLLNIFRALGSLPHLGSLTVDLGDVLLPIEALVVLLSSIQSLRSLRLTSMTLCGNMRDQVALETVLAQHPSLKSVSLEHCRGTGAIQALLTKPAALQKIRIQSTTLSQNGLWGGVSLAKICENHPNLKVLALDDVTDLAVERQIGVGLGAFQSHKLEAFHLTSKQAGQIAGEAIVEFLSNSKSISEVTVNLGRTWSDCGASYANVLASNNKLTKATLRIGSSSADRDGLDLKSNILPIANALKSSCQSRLTHLHLLLDLKKLRKNGLDKEIVSIFDSVLDENNMLQEIKILDEHNPSTRELPLPESLCWKLDLNRSGIPLLLQENNGLPPLDQYLDAIANSSEDINASFFALTNSPGLFCGMNNAQWLQQQQRQQAVAVHKKHKLSASYYYKQYLPFKKKAWPRRVKNMLARPVAFTQNKASSYYARSA